MTERGILRRRVLTNLLGTAAELGLSHEPTLVLFDD